MTTKGTLQRRGNSLTEIVVLVPIIAATMTVVFQVSVRSMRVQSQTARSLAAAASHDDLLRRVRDDAATAVSATLEHTGELTVLTLENRQPASQPAEENASAQPQVAYRVTGSHVTRIEQPRVGPQIVYNWDLGPADVNLNLETIAGKPRIVWISFARRPSDGHAEMGPPSRVLTSAVTINRGGVR